VKLKPLVGFDVDMVLADYVKSFVDVSRKLLKKPPKNYVQTDYLFTSCGWSEREERQIQAHLKSHYNYWRTLERMPSTTDLRKSAQDLNLFFITSRFSSDGAPMPYQTADWLHDQFGIRDAYVIYAAKKGPIVADLELDYFIDDKPQNCIEVKSALPSCEVFIQDAPYNKTFKDSRIRRVANVNAFLKEIKG